MLQVNAIPGPTGRLLQEMLAERGLLEGRVKGVVNYGYHPAGDLPTLNANAGRQDKYRELVLMREAGVSTIPFSQHFRDFGRGLVMGRNLHHTRGRDIVVLRAGEGGPRKDYYTELIDKDAEFRVWAFRNKAIASYEKRLAYPAKNGRRGRNKAVWNWANGYAYEFVHPDGVAEGLKAVAVDAVRALDLDFGAVDIMRAGRTYYVLEVNTAPGVEGRRQGLTSLVNCIERWAKNGFKPRREL